MVPGPIQDATVLGIDRNPIPNNRNPSNGNSKMISTNVSTFLSFEL